MPIYRHAELTDSFFVHFFDHSDFDTYDFEVCAVDNGSNQEDVTKVLEKWAAKHPDIVKVKVNEENRGFPGGTNDAIAMATGDFIVCISNDVQCLDTAWTSQLLQPHLDGKRCITGGQFINYNSLTFVESKIIEYIGGWCMCFPSTIAAELKELQKGQVFDEEFAPGYFEDVLLSFYAKYLLGCALIAPGQGMGDVSLHHIGGQTLNQESAPVNAIATRNQLYFRDKVRLLNAKYDLRLFV